MPLMVVVDSLARVVLINLLYMSLVNGACIDDDDDDDGDDDVGDGTFKYTFKLC